MVELEEADVLVRFADMTQQVKGREVSPRDTWSYRVRVFESLRESGAPPDALGWAWAIDKLDNSNKFLAAAKSWHSRNRTGTLMLCGTLGNGKTVAAARYALDHGAVWVKAGRVALVNHQSAEGFVGRLVNAKALVIDELGGAMSTHPVAVDRLAHIICERHEACRPTVITSNKSPQEIAVIYDAIESPRTKDRGQILAESRIIDRINQYGYIEESSERSLRQSGTTGAPENLYTKARDGLGLLIACESGTATADNLVRLRGLLGIETAEDYERARAAVLSQQAQLRNHMDRVVESSRFRATSTETESEASA